MTKSTSLITLLIFFAHFAIAQHSVKQDVLHLNNGWVIRGTILERNDSLVRIRTKDGNEFVFRSAEIRSADREIDWQHTAAGRWLAAVELGPLIAGRTTQNGVTTAAFSLQTAAVYRLKTWLGAGAGIGADLYATQTLLPLFLTIRGDWWNTGLATWFYFVDGGYSQNITQRSQTVADFRGGGSYAGGIGWRIAFSPNAGFLLSIGYRYQHTSFLSGGDRQSEDYRRIAVRAGFYL